VIAEQSKLIPARNTSLTMPAPRSIEGAVDRGVRRRSKAGAPTMRTRWSAGGAGLLARARRPGTPTPLKTWVPESWRDTPASQAGEGSLASSLAPPGAPSPRERGDGNGIRAPRPPEHQDAGRRSVGCLTSESD